jgi:hypothetical protein
MHYHAEVYVKSKDNIESQIVALMAPYQEADTNGDYRGFWDWYQIGGRWTGNKDKGYKPEEDPKNMEPCWLCGATGVRNDAIVRGKCNACNGTGTAIKWPTQWAKFPGDICTIEELPEDFECYTLLANGQVFHKEIWTGHRYTKTEFDGKPKKRLQEMGITEGYLVTVDYHS